MTDKHKKSPLSILLIEDSEDDAALILREFKRNNIEVCSNCIETREELHYYLQKQHWDIIISDYSLPRFNGLAAIAELKKSKLDIPLILVSGTIGEEVAVLAMKAGAHDYIMKDNLRRLVPAVERELREVQERKGREKAERAFRETEEYFRSIFDGAPIGITIETADGSFERANPEFCRMLGYSELELRKKTFIDVTHPDDRKIGLNETRKVFAGKLRSFKIEKRYIKKTGQIVWAAVSVSAFRKKHGKVINAVAMVEDITQRKQAEEILVNIAKGVSAEIGTDFFRALVQNLAGMLRADYAYIGKLTETTPVRVQTICVSGQNEFIDNFEYEVPGTPCQNTIKPESCCYPENVQQAFPHDPKLRNMQIDAYVGTPLVDSSGRTVGLLVVLFCQPLSRVDQTLSILRIFAARASAELERSLAEEALKESERKYRRIVETAQEGIWTIDANANTTYVNEKLAEMLGYTAEEMLGRHLFEFMDAKGRKIAERNLERRGRGIEEIHDFTFRRKDGSAIHTLLSTNPLQDKDGQYVGALAMVTDITVIKEAEIELKNSRQQLRNLAAHLQTLREDERLMIAREMHDELGQVLTALKMDLTLLERDINSKQDRLEAASILTEIDAMKKVIDTTIRKIRKLITELRPEVLDNLGLEAALQWQIDEFKTRTNIHYTLETQSIDLEKEPSVAVFRIFQEALTNIARHSRAKNVAVKMSTEDHSCILSISDDGVGIDREVLNNGKTFGLLGMKERAIIFGGEVSITGKKNRGTTVEVRIPITKSE